MYPFAAKAIGNQFFKLINKNILNTFNQITISVEKHFV